MRSCYVRFLSPIRKYHDRVVMLKLAFSTHFINKTKRDRKQHDSRGGVTRPRPPSFFLFRSAVLSRRLPITHGLHTVLFAEGVEWEMPRYSTL